MGLEDYHFVDLHATQLQLSQVSLHKHHLTTLAETYVPQIKLPGLAGQLQARCFVEGAYAEAWHAAVAGGLTCDHSAVDVHWLVKSAKEQCGSWCLWDL